MIEHILNRIYEDLAYLQSPVILSRLVSRRAVAPVSVWDTHVRLRSDLVVDVRVEQGQPSRVTLRYSSGAPIGRFSKSGETEDTEQLNADFGRLLMKSLGQVLDGDSVEGLLVQHRPLIAAPIWTDGLKEGLCALDAFAALNVFRRTVLLGPPGSGKSTVARALAACQLGGLLGGKRPESPQRLGLWDSKPCLPVFVELGELVRWPRFPSIEESVRAEVLIEFVVDRYGEESGEFRKQLLEELQHGDALLILDGLDEVAIPYGVPNALAQRQQQIQDLARSLHVRFPSSRLIVTSRPAGYSDWTLEGFSAIRLLPLDDRGTWELSDRLYRALGREDMLSNESLSRLHHELARVPAELREQPLFATLLLLLFLDGGDLPKRRASLIEASLRLLLTAWTLPRMGAESLMDLLRCTEEDLELRLEVLAYKVHAEAALRLDRTRMQDEPEIGRGMILDELLEMGGKVDIARALDYLSNRAGILLSPAPRTYRFAHRLFREYLAASHIARQPQRAVRIRELLELQPIAWQEPAILLGEMLHEKERFAELWAVVEELLSAGGVSELTGEPPSPTAPLLVWLAGRILLGPSAAASETATSKRVLDLLRRALAEVLKPNSGLSHQNRVEAAEALALLGDTRSGVGVVEGVPDIAWSIVPGGPFRMGTSPEGLRKLSTLDGEREWDLSHECPSGTIEVKCFEIAEYPVTALQYQCFVEATDGYARDAWWTAAGLAWRKRAAPAPPPSIGTAGTCPQTSVTWYEAVAFCRWLSARSGRSVRLPTEAEWEKASRGVDGRLFPWGDEPRPECANVAEAHLDRITPVGCFAREDGPWGAQGPKEMIGNCWEWCSTIMQSQEGTTLPYPYCADERENLDADDAWLRVTRGGYYGNISIVARCAYRGRDVPSARFARQGFRVVRECGEV